MTTARDVLLGRADPLAGTMPNTQFPTNPAPQTMPGPMSQDPGTPNSRRAEILSRLVPYLRQPQGQGGMGRPGFSDDNPVPGRYRDMIAQRGAAARSMMANAAAGIGPRNQPQGWLPPVGGSTGMSSPGFAGFDSMGRPINPGFQYDASFNRIEPPKPLGFVGAFPNGGAMSNAQGNLVPPRPPAPPPPPGPGQAERTNPGVLVDQATGQFYTVGPDGVRHRWPDGAVMDAPVGHATGTGGLLSGALATISRRRPALAQRITAAIGPTMAGSGTGGATSTSSTGGASSPATTPTPASTTPSTAGTTTPVATRPAPAPAPAGLSPNAQTVYDQRTGVQFPNVNLYSTDAQFGKLPPSVMQSTLLGYQDAYGVPVGDLQAEINRYALQSGTARQGY